METSSLVGVEQGTGLLLTTTGLLWSRFLHGGTGTDQTSLTKDGANGGLGSPRRFGGFLSLIPRLGRLGGCHVSGRYLGGGQRSVLHRLKRRSLH